MTWALLLFSLAATPPVSATAPTPKVGYSQNQGYYYAKEAPVSLYAIEGVTLGSSTFDVVQAVFGRTMVEQRQGVDFICYEGIAPNGQPFYLYFSRSKGEEKVFDFDVSDGRWDSETKTPCAKTTHTLPQTQSGISLGLTKEALTTALGKPTSIGKPSSNGNDFMSWFYNLEPQCRQQSTCGGRVRTSVHAVLSNGKVRKLTIWHMAD